MRLPVGLILDTMGTVARVVRLVLVGASCLTAHSPSLAAHSPSLAADSPSLAAGSSSACPPELHVHADAAGSDAAWLDRGGEGAAGGGTVRSLHAAQAAVRHHRRRCPAARVTVHINGSSSPFELHAPLLMGPEDSGTADAPVVWRAVPGRAPPVISGGVSVTGWTKGGTVSQHGGSGDGVRWTAPLPAIYRERGEQLPNSLWVGETRYHLARLPAPTVAPDRSGEYTALHWAQALDPENHTAEANRWGVVVRTADLPASLLAAGSSGTPIPDNVYLTVFHSYDTSSVRIRNITHFVNHTRPGGATMCCWNRIIQGCNSSSQCDRGGEGCIPSGTPTKRYGPAVCHTCASQGKKYDPASSGCKPREGDDDDGATTLRGETSSWSVINFANPTSEFISNYLTDSHRRYYISNVAEGLSTAGMFLVRPAHITLVAPAGIDPSVAGAVAGHLISLKVLEGANHLRFEGLSYQHLDWQGHRPNPNPFGAQGSGGGGAWPANDGAAMNASGAIQVTNGTGITITHCQLEHLGGSALAIGSKTQNISLLSSEMYDSAIGGVYMDGYPNVGAKYGEGGCGGITIENSILRDGGHVVPQGVGMHISGCSNVTVRRNAISSFHGKGIVIRGSIDPYANTSMQYARRDECSRPYACCENLLIEHNHIHDLVNGTLSDKAFIQLWGAGGSVERGTRTLIRRNTLHDLYTFNPGNGAGMYDDSFTTQVTWQQNIVWHCGGTGNFYQHWGAGNVVDNCIMANLAAPANAADPGNSIDTWNGGGYFHGDWFNSFNFTRNIVYTTQGQLFSSVGFVEYENCTFDRNLYFSTNASGSPIGFPPPGPRGGTGKRISPDAWQALGKDKHSLFAEDPQFVNAAELDFRLQATSPALLSKIGFEPWNYSDVGPVGVVVGPAGLGVISAAAGL